MKLDLPPVDMIERVIRTARSRTVSAQASDQLAALLKHVAYCMDVITKLSETDSARICSARGVQNDPCGKCKGTGTHYYPNTATWHSRPGVIAGQAFTNDVCDVCWGTGDKHRTGVNLRELFEERRKMVQLIELLQRDFELSRETAKGVLYRSESALNGIEASGFLRKRGGN